jgi:hypothetical protein
LYVLYCSNRPCSWWRLRLLVLLIEHQLVTNGIAEAPSEEAVNPVHLLVLTTLAVSQALLDRVSPSASDELWSSVIGSNVLSLPVNVVFAQRNHFEKIIKFYVKLGDTRPVSIFKTRATLRACSGELPKFMPTWSRSSHFGLWTLFVAGLHSLSENLDWATKWVEMFGSRTRSNCR